MTFSKDLAIFIQSKNPDHEIWKLDLIIHKKILSNDIPKNSCVFGILSNKSKKLLRATVAFEEACYLCQDSSRAIVECYVRKKTKWKDALC